MQRLSAASYGGGVNNSAVGGTSSRDTARADSSFSSSNFSLSSRRLLPLTPYKLKCDKESLNCRLGPPDFYPQTPNCPEETVTSEYLQAGYKEIVEGIEESKEIALSYVDALTRDDIVKCKEDIRRRLRAINESRAQKRKAGQVYGVPLSGPLLNKPSVFPDQRHCGEDFRKKWIEGLSQHHKRLHSLAEHVPHGFRKRHLFEVLIRHNVPLLRATWFIKVTYLNQARHTSSSVSSGAPDRTQLARTELWTKDVIEYMQYLLDEYTSTSISYGRDQSPQTHLASTVQHKGGALPVIGEGEEPTLQFKWRYMVRILQWHQAEGLLQISPVIEWVLNQLQGKESVDVLQLLFPIIFNVIDTVALSQTYVRMLVEIAVRSIHNLSQASGADVVDNSRRSYVAAVLGEMLRYLMLAVPDTFVGLDCFPLPPSVVPDFINGRNNLLMGIEKYQYGPQEFSSIYNSKGPDAYYRYMSFGYVVSSVQRRAANLTLAASPGSQGHGLAKVVQTLDGVLILGDARDAYNCLFENLFDGGVEESWIAEVSPCLRSSLKWIGTVSLSLVCSVFLLCEWATCDFRDCRTAMPHDLKFTGRKDFSQVYIAVLLLKLKKEDMHRSLQSRTVNNFSVDTFAKGSPLHNSGSAGTAIDNVSELRNGLKSSEESVDSPDILQSPGPLHDILVCWLDQHEATREGFKRLQMLIVELIRFGIFYPQAYVRQLIVSGIMDRNESPMDFDRQKRHYRVLKQLPGSYLFDALKETKIAEVPHLHEAVRVYSNERRLVLNGLLSGHPSHLKTANGSSFNFDLRKRKDNATAGRDGASSASHDPRKKSHLCSPLARKREKKKCKVDELKDAISILLHLPNICSASIDAQPDESQVSLKRPIGLLGTKIDTGDGTPGCEECKRAKRLKVSEERNSLFQGVPPNPSDDDDTWWVRKGPKPLETPKVELPLKPTKQASRGRQKVVRKTHSLAKLQAARIEGSQGASTSHVCDNKINCPHHRTGTEGENSKLMDGSRSTHLTDVVSLGKALKQLRSLEKRHITLWLIAIIKQLVEGNEKAVAKVGQCSNSFSSVDDRSAVRWKLGEDDLSFILYLLDVSSDLLSAVKFLLWLLPKALPSPISSVHGGRNILALTRNPESSACEVGEAFLLSSIRRYENILIAADLIPEALSAAMLRAVAVMTSHGRASVSAAFIYSRLLLKKFGSVASVAKWEKNFKTTCDQRLLSELETGRPLDGELGYSLVGVAAGVEDVDEYFRQKISGRISRITPTMKEIVQRHVEEAAHFFYGKERKHFVATAPKGSGGIEKWDDAFQIAHQIVAGLVDCVRQSGGAAQEWDPTVVASAVSAIVGNVGSVVAKLPDFPAGNSYLGCARHVVRIHIYSLCLLREALGDRQSRVFEVALATEAFSAVSGAFASAKAPRSQFQLSSETHDSSANMSTENLNNPAKIRATKAAAAVSALVIGAVVHGVATLERMLTIFRLKEGLDVLQFISVRSNSNGLSRSIGALKVDNGIEVCLHWFRLLAGDCRTVSDGLVVDLLAETYALALSRMQRMLPLNLVLPPAYSIFAMVIWRPYIINSNIVNREDIQMYQSLSSAITDVIRHQPFRDVCLRDTRAFYDLLASDVSDSEFAAMLELHSSDKNLKTMAFVPLRARLFLNAILDFRLPQFPHLQDDGAWVPGYGDSKAYSENEKPPDQLVHVLDTLQLAKFHWQWIELRLLLNQQVLLEKIESHNMSLVEAVRSLSSNAELCECENNFAKIVLTRLLVRPDAAPLYSEVVHLFGRLFEESLLVSAKWFLAGIDVLLGRKSIRQRLTNVAQQGGYSTKIPFWKPWGWANSVADLSAHRGEKRKLEATSLEEGEVVEEGTDIKRLGRSFAQTCDVEGSSSSKLYVTEKALAELVLPCMDQSSNESRNTFASDLIKQMNTIEQQISTLTRGLTKQAGTAPSGVEGGANKNSNRKGIRGGSPGLSRRPAGVADSAPPSSAALRASMWLRLQFILRLLPIIYADRESTNRNMRHMLASVLLRLLGTRVVHEDADYSFFPVLRNSLSKREVEPLMDASVAAPLDLSGDSLFDWFLSVLHGLLSTCKPSWLKPKSTSKSTIKSPRDLSASERDVFESLQADLDQMQLPAVIRRRLQAAMPVLPPSLPPSISCQPPTVSTTALSPMQSSLATPAFQAGNSNLPQRSPVSSARSSPNVAGKGKPLQSQDPDVEIDPWMLLEDGTASVPVSGNNSVGVGSDHANLKACSWLKGAVRVRRTDLTYIGTVDDDS